MCPISAQIARALPIQKKAFPGITDISESTNAALENLFATDLDGYFTQRHIEHPPTDAS